MALFPGQVDTRILATTKPVRKVNLQDNSATNLNLKTIYSMIYIFAPKTIGVSQD